MEPNEMTKIRKEIAEKIISKFYSFKNKEDFVTWVKGMTQLKFQAIMVQCLDDVIADGNAKNATVLEIKNSLEG